MAINKISAGLLMYRTKEKQLEVFLVHPCGPFFKNKDAGCWSIPKGLPACNASRPKRFAYRSGRVRSNAGRQHDSEDLLETAKREFSEETGISFARVPLANVNFINLDFVTYPNGKKVYAWAFENDLPENFQLKSNPSDSGWPENDRGEYFSLEIAKIKILPAQKEFLVFPLFNPAILI